MAALVSYESSSDEESIENTKCEVIKTSTNKRNRVEVNFPKKKQKLPVPDVVKDMFNSSCNDEHHEDDPGQHFGKVRSFEHERGNWASYVYFQFEDVKKLTELTEDIKNYVQPHITFYTTGDYHLSLSRTLVLRHHWIESLLESLKSKLKKCDRCTCELSEVELYCNDEMTRTFLGLRIRTGFKQLASYVKEIDSALEEFKLPIYYKNPSFHISIAWAHGDIRGKIDTKMKQTLQNIVSDYFEMYPRLSVFTVTGLCFKTGNKVYGLPLCYC